MSNDLHDKIMNLPLPRRRELITLSGQGELAYKFGHRDARHAAAELAIGYVVEASPANGAVGEMPEYSMIQQGVKYYTADQLRAAVLAEREACAKECDFQANWAKGEAEDKDNSVRYRNENRERQTAAELCAGSIRART